MLEGIKLIKFYNNHILDIMTKFMGLKTGLRARAIALIVGAVALIIAAIFLNSIRISGESNPLTQTIEGGESSLAAIGRSHESFSLARMGGSEEPARQLLKAARISQEHAEAMLTSATRTADEFVINMAENYGMLLDSSHVMTQGVDNLLTISKELEKTLGYYRQKAYLEAAEEASVCLQTLVPLVDPFGLRNQTLDGVNYHYLASGHRDRVKHAVVEYREEMRIYLEYILLLESIIKGVDYLREMGSIRELFDQLQHELASKDYENAQSLLQEILRKLQLLMDQQYQKAANTASELDPSLLTGDAYNVAQDVKNQIKDLQGLQGFESYLDSVMKYMAALGSFEQGDLEGTEGAIDEGLESLGRQGEGAVDPEVQRFYTALRNAFNSLRMQVRGQPDQG